MPAAHPNGWAASLRLPPRSDRGDGRVVRGHVDALAALVEVHLAGGRGVQEVVARPADEPAGGELRPALHHDDAALLHRLAAVDLHPAALRLRVAAVLDRPLTLLVCHVPIPLEAQSKA